MPIESNLLFEYALKFPNGKYYTGRTCPPEKPDYWQGEKHEAFTYTEKGAYAKIASHFSFRFCTVEKIY